ncbi:MAG: UbiX family flavin prenyltransferase [Verrucomicrobium sp.]|nr:UbiX family flavin prenyltransferase [Verrucomicrobium sp.]
MKLVVAITGASGSLYAQRLLECLAAGPHHVDVVTSLHAEEVAAAETGALSIPAQFQVYQDRTMQVPFVSGSAKYDAMVVIPCSMGTIGRIAHGYSDSTITRAADVFLKEKRPLLLVPREMPWNLLQARNVVSLLEAGATVLPASPSFYGKPETVRDVVDTVVARVLDHLKIDHELGRRWKEPAPKE